MNYHNFYAKDNFSLFNATKFLILVHSSQNIYIFGLKIWYYITRGKEKAKKIKKVVEKEIREALSDKPAVFEDMVEREGSTLGFVTVKRYRIGWETALYIS